MHSAIQALGEKPEDPPPILLNGKAVGKLLSCSARTVSRLADAGRMPAPVRLGALVRWDQTTIESWISQGCPTVRHLKGGK